jgi:hypothetical protein
VSEYLREENQALRQQLGKKRLRLTDDQRRRLAVREKAIGRRAPDEVASLVTPDTRKFSDLGAIRCLERLGRDAAFL